MQIVDYREIIAANIFLFRLMFGFDCLIQGNLHNFYDHDFSLEDFFKIHPDDILLISFISFYL